MYLQFMFERIVNVKVRLKNLGILEALTVQEIYFTGSHYHIVLKLEEQVGNSVGIP